jgi:hypothetical protein
MTTYLTLRTEIPFSVRLKVLGSLCSFGNSGIGLPHSPAAAGLARIRASRFVREVLECGSPMPLSLTLLHKVTASFSRTHTILLPLLATSTLGILCRI